VNCVIGTNVPGTSRGSNKARKPLTLLVLLPVAIASVLLAGCGSPNDPPGPTGTLTGTLQAVGGPAAEGPRALSGQINLHGSSGNSPSIVVGASGRFSVPVTVGTYTVSGQSPQYRGGAATCHASGPVTVTKGATVKVQVDCEEK
jgi:hypothetical protein